jgi:hypothetical protein
VAGDAALYERWQRLCPSGEEPLSWLAGALREQRRGVAATGLATAGLDLKASRGGMRTFQGARWLDPPRRSPHRRRRRSRRPSTPPSALAAGVTPPRPR